MKVKTVSPLWSDPPRAHKRKMFSLYAVQAEIELNASLTGHYTANYPRNASYSFAKADDDIPPLQRVTFVVNNGRQGITRLLLTEGGRGIHVVKKGRGHHHPHLQEICTWKAHPTRWSHQKTKNGDQGNRGFQHSLPKQTGE